jgi:hypothetical protein
MVRRRFSSFAVSLLLLTALSSGALHADSNEPETTSSPLDVGLIFNIDGLALDFESYQGGLGVKLGKNSLAFRVLFDLFLSSTVDRVSWSLDVGTSFEYHFVKGALSPYVGAYISLGYALQKDEISDDTYTLLRSIPVSIGPLFGIEMFPLDFLSVFLEYAVQFEYNFVMTETSIAGSVTNERDDELSINTALGNSTKLGIVIYFLHSK